MLKKLEEPKVPDIPASELKHGVIAEVTGPAYVGELVIRFYDRLFCISSGGHWKLDDTKHWDDVGFRVRPLPAGTKLEVA